ncbi:hypothetical protein F8388_008964 [Cannabis sativa]|uniref:Aminotransferase-like plant mobile domain-containing protein n=1 Tax=Cannabis sativa TaxID=3483 RepID=A0A7J6GG07_CANSA|nr:hypothetical protein F8388_008964 [Cannabis sativa]
MRKTCSALTEASNDLKKNDATCDMHDWITHFHKGNDYSLVELVACITLWLSRYVFPSKQSRSVRRALYPLACKLARGKQLPIGAFYLGTLYHNLDSIVRDINSRKFNFRSYLTNIDAYFTLDMYDGSVVPLTSEVRSNLNISRGGVGFRFAICLPQWLLCLQDNSKSLSWSLEKASKSCLLGSLQVSKPSYDLFQIPCKGRQGGVSSKFVDLWMRQNNIWSVCQSKNCDRERGPTEGEDLTTETGAHITSQETQPVDPPRHGLVGEHHVPSRSIPDDMMSTFLEGDQSVLDDACWGSNLSEKDCIPVGPIPTIASFGTGGFLDFSKTSNLFSQDEEDISSRTPTMANIGQNAHKAYPSAPTDNPLVIEHTQVESEYGKDLATLVGLDSECLAPLGPYTSRFCSLYASLYKDFISLLENLSPIKKSLFIQLSSPCLPLLRLTFEISEQHYSHLLEYWKILCLILSERPSVLGKIVESYFETVNSSIRYHHLVGELEKMCEERDIKVREIEELNHKIAGIKQRCKDQGSPSNTWVYTPP